MAIVRLSVDVEVQKGDPARLVQALSKKENRKQAADYVAHVLIPDVMETAEVEPTGGYVHVHDHSSGNCDTCRREAQAFLPDFD